MGRRLEDFYTGKAAIKLASFWLGCLGFITAIATITALDAKVESKSVSFMLASSYVVFFFWLKANIDHVIWWLKPQWKPSGEKVGSKEKWRAMVIGGAVAGWILMITMGIVTEIIKLLTKV